MRKKENLEEYLKRNAMENNQITWVGYSEDFIKTGECQINHNNNRIIFLDTQILDLHEQKKRLKEGNERLEKAIETQKELMKLVPTDCSDNPLLEIEKDMNFFNQ